ncbi:hypothetical protein HELRODRAFT_160803 [Helobdella robusta]|uniref:MGA conserved domain-containing protein n=1 Tax=Helobdella robusta TaxID=6412 RepID=T1EQQ7_HELRO|nr:hypothetical protein HELRODRAFT_160803 [Helobdella robusta]ESO06613.1 hypothetical protein HELRODRAFT_160803 [Helobdella robusta]
MALSALELPNENNKCVALVLDKNEDPREERPTKENLLVSDEQPDYDTSLIQYPDFPKSVSKVCKNDFCQLGCICNSLKVLPKNVEKKHCGKVQCMFSCHCQHLTRSRAPLFASLSPILDSKFSTYSLESIKFSPRMTLYSPQAPAKNELLLNNTSDLEQSNLNKSDGAIRKGFQISESHRKVSTNVSENENEPNVRKSRRVKVNLKSLFEMESNKAEISTNKKTRTIKSKRSPSLPASEITSGLASNQDQKNSEEYFEISSESEDETNIRSRKSEPLPTTSANRLLVEALKKGASNKANVKKQSATTNTLNNARSSSRNNTPPDDENIVCYLAKKIVIKEGREIELHLLMETRANCQWLDYKPSLTNALFDLMFNRDGLPNGKRSFCWKRFRIDIYPVLNKGSNIPGRLKSSINMDNLEHIKIEINPRTASDQTRVMTAPIVLNDSPVRNSPNILRYPVANSSDTHTTLRRSVLPDATSPPVLTSASESIFLPQSPIVNNVLVSKSQAIIVEDDQEDEEEAANYLSQKTSPRTIIANGSSFCADPPHLVSIIDPFKNRKSNSIIPPKISTPRDSNYQNLVIKVPSAAGISGSSRFNFNVKSLTQSKPVSLISNANLSHGVLEMDKDYDDCLISNPDDNISVAKSVLTPPLPISNNSSNSDRTIFSNVNQDSYLILKPFIDVDHHFTVNPSTASAAIASPIRTTTTSTITPAVNAPITAATNVATASGTTRAGSVTVSSNNSNTSNYNVLTTLKMTDFSLKDKTFKIVAVRQLNNNSNSTEKSENQAHVTSALTTTSLPTTVDNKNNNSSICSNLNANTTVNRSAKKISSSLLSNSFFELVKNMNDSSKNSNNSDDVTNVAPRPAVLTLEKDATNTLHSESDDASTQNHQESSKESNSKKFVNSNASKSTDEYQTKVDDNSLDINATEKIHANDSKIAVKSSSDSSESLQTKKTIILPKNPVRYCKLFTSAISANATSSKTSAGGPRAVELDGITGIRRDHLTKPKPNFQPVPIKIFAKDSQKMVKMLYVEPHHISSPMKIQPAFNQTPPLNCIEITDSEDEDDKKQAKLTMPGKSQLPRNMTPGTNIDDDGDCYNAAHRDDGTSSSSSSFSLSDNFPTVANGTNGEDVFNTTVISNISAVNNSSATTTTPAAYSSQQFTAVTTNNNNVNYILYNVNNSSNSGRACYNRNINSSVSNCEVISISTSSESVLTNEQSNAREADDDNGITIITDDYDKKICKENDEQVENENFVKTLLNAVADSVVDRQTLTDIAKCRHVTSGVKNKNANSTSSSMDVGESDALVITLCSADNKNSHNADNDSSESGSNENRSLKKYYNMLYKEIIQNGSGSEFKSKKMSKVEILNKARDVIERLEKSKNRICNDLFDEKRRRNELLKKLKQIRDASKQQQQSGVAGVVNID